MSPFRVETGILLILLTSVLCLGCLAKTPAGPIRVSMSAPDLENLPPERVRTTMWVLAAEIQLLERLLTDPAETESESKRAAVASTLLRMRVAAQTLDTPGRSTQHPALNQNLEFFLGRLDRAKRALDRNPPNYFSASTIAGSCFVCHGGGQGTAQLGRPPSRS